MAAAGLETVIDIRLGDGLNTLAPDEADDIVIAGMGGETIAAILEAAPWIRDSRYRLILQPMTRAEHLHRYLLQNGFSILREEAVQDEGRLYLALLAAFSDAPPAEEGDLRFLTAPSPPPARGNGISKSKDGFCWRRAGGLRAARFHPPRKRRKPTDWKKRPRPAGLWGGIDMTVEDIYHFLNEKAPFSTAEEWDNTGAAGGRSSAGGGAGTDGAGYHARCGGNGAATGRPAHRQPPSRHLLPFAPAGELLYPLCSGPGGYRRRLRPHQPGPGGGRASTIPWPLCWGCEASSLWRTASAGWACYRSH